MNATELLLVRGRIRIAHQASRSYVTIEAYLSAPLEWYKLMKEFGGRAHFTNEYTHRWYIRMPGDLRRAAQVVYRRSPFLGNAIRRYADTPPGPPSWQVAECIEEWLGSTHLAFVEL
jgi:hypothetical protein